MYNNPNNYKYNFVGFNSQPIVLGSGNLRNHTYRILDPLVREYFDVP